MAAASLDGPRAVSLTRRPVPEPGPGEVRVRIEACGICGSDLHFYHRGPLCPGTSPGHEMAGVVDVVGDGVAGFAVGDRVAVEPLASCGRCHACQTGRDAICPEARLFGVHQHGGLAEYLAVPARRLFRVAADLPPALAALTEPMAVAVHGLRRGQLQAGQRVLVLGAGTIGLVATRAALALGAGEVFLTARHAHQAELGRHLGATRVLAEHEATPEGLARLGCDAPFDLVVETVGGDASTLRDAITAVRPGGTISVLGLFFGDVGLDSLSLFVKESTLTWSNCYARGPEGADFEAAAALVSRCRDELAGLATHQVPLAEVERAFRLATDKKSGTVKVSVLP